ncbi:uncharacterized protein LOC141802821 [Halichoeres trimaculatus]|uniref:uncharacterized protein LOC141802821 n=1 Tax=Halichoeres trimaculatus TaxID=147232 RepID=UPI003D9F09EE
MSKTQILRGFINQRLSAAAEEIFELFERTIAEYEEQLCRSKEENKRQQKLLDAVYNPQLRLHRADVSLLLESQKEPPEEWDPSPLQEDSEPSHIKEEEEELWRDGEQLQGLEKADTTKFFFPPVSVKSEDEEAQSPLGSFSEVKTEEFSEQETEGGSDWTGHQTGLNSVKNSKNETDRKFHSCSECGRTFTEKLSLDRHMKIHTGEKPFSCFKCDQEFDQKVNLTNHMIMHTREKPFSCSDCGKSLKTKENLTAHMRVHTGEKPFSCSECTAKFRSRKNLIQHMVVHTDVKPFSCSECGKAYKHNSTLKFHMALHTGEKPFSCSLCSQSFSWPSQLRIHKCAAGGQETEGQYSQTEERGETEPGADVEDCGGPEEARNSDQEIRSHAEIEVKIEDSSDPGYEDKDGFSSKTRGNSFGFSLDVNNGISDLNTTPIGEKPFICPVCGKRLGYSGHLKTHMRTHTGEKPFSCSVCGKRFTQKCSQKQHMVLHTGEKPFNCSVCGQSFAWRSQIKRHECVKGQSSELLLNEICVKIEAETGAGRKSNRNTDQVTHLGPESQIKTQDSSKLKRGDNNMETSECQSDLDSHENHKISKRIKAKASDKKRFSCFKCNKRFTRQRNLKKHMRCHTGEKPFHCSICDKRFSYKETLVRHSKFHFDEKPFSCTVCSKNFSRKENFARHMRFHSGEKPFGCSFCKKRFTRKDHAVTHMRIHTGEKPFSCSVCGKRTGCTTSLRVHMRIHTGEKPFSCSVCSRKFTQRSSLTEHMVLHTGEKTFDCSECGKRMSCKASLKVHMRTHTGEKPFNCSVCSKGFTQKGNLKEHMATHKKEKLISRKSDVRSHTHVSERAAGSSEPVRQSGAAEQ